MISQENRSVRFAIWGAGVMGQQIARTAARIPGVEVVAVIDRDLDRAARVCSESAAVAAQSLAEALLLTDIDAIYVGLPNAVHHQACLEAAEQKLDVLIDKPLTTSFAQAIEVCQAAEASGRYWMMGFSFRFRQEWQLAREAIRRGDIGTPYFVSDNVIEAYQQTPSWYWQQDAEGGTLNLQSHHVFDRWEWLLGSRIDSLTAQQLCPETLQDRADADVVTTLMARFVGGALGSSAMSFGLKYDAPHRIALTVQGSDGMIEIDENRRISIATADGIWTQVSDSDWLTAQLDDFFAGVRGERRNQPTLDDGLRAVLLADVARAAAVSGDWQQVVTQSLGKDRT